MSLKTHYRTDDTNVAVCNRNKNQKKLTFKPSKVDCEKCKATNIWQDDMSIEESKRVASSGELGKDNMCIENLSQNELNKLISFCGDNNISHSISRVEGRITLLNATPKQMMRIRSFIQNEYRDIEEKTQLEIDTEKYNLSSVHVEILSKVGYEVVEVDLSNECEGCLLSDCDFCPSDISGKNTCVRDRKEYIFKQINKKEEQPNIQKWITRDNGDIEIVNVSHDEVLKTNEWLRKEKLSNQFVSHDKNIVIRFILEANENEFKKFMLTLEEKEEPLNEPNVWVDDKLKYNPDEVDFKKGIPGFKKTLDDMYSTMLAKNSDYTGEKGAFDNFLMVDKLGITSPEKGILVRMTDKICRISNLLENDAKVKDEAITDTLLDLANYSVILKCLIESKNKELEV